uniref:Reverse transcriptase domain-containing protein n=1 Tax=Latimeria chalumnae TaxID=7897 RepID=H2ZWF0_LATCH
GDPTILVSHLFYMDDLKLYAKNSDQLQTMLELVSSFSKSIAMEIGVDKCAVLHANERHDNVQLLDGAEIEELERKKRYKYLGMQQLLNINTMQIKEAVTATFKKWLKLIMKTQLNTKNKIQAINTWASPVLAYTYGVLKWSRTSLDALDRKVRATLKENCMHHPYASMDRLYLPRRVRGRGLLNLADLYRGQEAGLHDYFLKKDLPIHQAAVRDDKGHTPLFLSKDDHGFEITTLQSRLDESSMKSLHGQFHTALHKDNIDVEASKGTLFPEMEGFILAIQDQVVATNNYRKYILKENISNKCRFCGTITESIQHIVDGCPVLSYSEYLHRHNNIAKIIHQQLAKDNGLLGEETPHFKYQPAQILEKDGVKIYWDEPITTDHTVAHSQEILVLDWKNKWADIIDIAIPNNENVSKTWAEKIRKYQDFASDLKHVYQLESMRVLPVIISVNGLVPKALHRSFEHLRLPKKLISQCQKAALLATACIVWKTLGMAG